MRYESKDDLSPVLRETLPEQAQDLYIEGYQKAWDDYDEEQGGDLGRAGYAHLQGINAVELEYTKVNNVWYHKGEEPENGEEKEGESLLEKIKGVF